MPPGIGYNLSNDRLAMPQPALPQPGTPGAAWNPFLQVQPPTPGSVPGGGGFPGTTFRGTGGGLDEQRGLAFRALNEQRGQYGDPFAQAYQTQLAQRAAGQDVPFTDQVRGLMLAQSADASAGQYAGEQQQILRAMANAGLSGSGLQASALANAQRRAARTARQGRQQINTRAELENYNARERAMEAAAQYLQQRAANNWLAAQQEVMLRSQFREVEEDQAGGGGGGQTAASPAAGGAVSTAGVPGQVATGTQPTQAQLWQDYLDWNRTMGAPQRMPFGVAGASGYRMAPGTPYPGFGRW